MIQNNTNNLILQDLNQEQVEYWFDLKQKKFLHNVDTFYYSVKLHNNFLKDTKDNACLKLREFFNQRIDRTNYNLCLPLEIPGLDMQLNIRNFHYAGFYNINIECPDMFDIFIADTVPPDSNGNESVTSEIVVQIRSYLLWQYGPTKAFEYSYKAVLGICAFFKLSISEVKENRVDYCWHSNYLQNPEKFFNIENFSKMQVSHYKRVHYEYAFRPNDEYENDYISLGKRSDKCFVRIYLKSKEVVEKGYKAFFFKEWLFNGLISRYDFYVYEKAYLKHSWKYVDIARLEFYSEFGSNQNDIELCKAIVSGSLEKSDDYIAKLADKLTPRVTLITNVEFQTMRRMSKTYNLIITRDNECKGPCKRIYDYLDNRLLITEYLTHSVLRLVDMNGDENKSRRDYCAFWKALRSCRIVDVKKSSHELKLTRDYTRNLNSQIVKNRIINNTVTFSLYTKGINNDNVLVDSLDFLNMLNDNDIFNMKNAKARRINQLNKFELNSPLIDFIRSHQYRIIDVSTGEYKDIL